MAITIDLSNITDLYSTRSPSTILRLCAGTSDDPMVEPGPHFWEASTSVEEGRAVIHKNFNIMMVDECTIQPRDVCPTEVLYVAGIPKKGDKLAEDDRYYFTGNATIEHLEENSRFWVYQCEYALSSLSASVHFGKRIKSVPWNNGPTNVSISYPEEVVSFQFARDEQNNRFNTNVATKPPRNSAGDLIEAQTKKYYFQLQFTYCLKKSDFSRKECLKMINSVNAEDVEILGFDFPAGSALIVNLQPTYHNEVVESDDSMTSQWWEIAVTIQQDVSGDGFAQKFLDIGDRARFRSVYNISNNGVVSNVYGSTLLPIPQPIYSWKSWNGSQGQLESSGSIQFGNVIMLCKAKQLFEAQFPNMQFAYERMTQIPLTPEGEVYASAMNQFSENYGRYHIVTFREHPIKSWKGLKLPKKLD